MIPERLYLIFILTSQSLFIVAVAFGCFSKCNLKYCKSTALLENYSHLILFPLLSFLLSEPKLDEGPK